jgi:protein O-mannose beta-1,4-N-acetylglucosaminyltransferase
VIGYEEEIEFLKRTITDLQQKEKRRVPVPYDPRLGAAVSPKETVDPEEELFDKMVVFDNYVPPSVVACTGHDATDRVCRIKNLCFDPARNLFFILKNGATIVQNGKQVNETRLVDGTSIDGHNRFFLDYIESHPSTLLNRPVHWVERVTYLVARFHRLNIMHTLHDDFMGLFHLAKLYGPASREDPTAPFSLDTNIFFTDWYEQEHYDYLYRMISQNPLQYRSRWRNETEHPVCFAEAIVGNSKHSTWYNYGFVEPQGPIQGKEVDGLHVRDAARYIMRRVGVAGWNREQLVVEHARLHREAVMRRLAGGYSSSSSSSSCSSSSSSVEQIHDSPITTTHYITIFTRQRDRLILNQQELANALQKTYALPVRTVRMEDQSLTEQIIILRTTLIAVGMHGSALILALFLPPGALLVELFPYAVPPQNYTPYKTLCELRGMRVVYRAWSNRHRGNSRAHPERKAEWGGLVHLGEEERRRVEGMETVPPHLCCRDPVWLYRIYQDTIVHIGELVELIDEGIMEAHGLVGMADDQFYSLVPASPDQLECTVVTASDEPTQLDIHVSWTRPWNGVDTNVYGLWVHQLYRELITAGNGTNTAITSCRPGVVYDLWVRAYTPDGKTPGLYSERYQCKCELGATAQRIERSVQ